MLEITIPEQDLFMERKEEFIHIKETKLQLEHSLISLRRWEGIHHKAFLSKKEDKTVEEIIDYIRCMTLNRSVQPEAYLAITPEMAEEIIQYINDPRTAATFPNRLPGASRHSGEFISAETIYYWMISFQIPVEFEKWHLNQLLALIKFVSIKSGPVKKMPTREAAAERAALNAKRRAQYGTRG